jgi:hypothetical protein
MVGLHQHESSLAIRIFMNTVYSTTHRKTLYAGLIFNFRISFSNRLTGITSLFTELFLLKSEGIGTVGNSVTEKLRILMCPEL